MKINLPEKVLMIINNLQFHGYEAYAVGGCVEQLEAPVGMTVPCGNAQALAEAALALAARKGALAGECRAYAQARFDRAQAVEQYVALYQKKIEDAGKLC